MQFRDGETWRRFHHIIPRISPPRRIQRIPGLILPGKSRSRYCWPLRFSSQSFSMSHGTFGVTWSQFKFLGVLKNDGDGPSGVDLQKRFLKYPSSSVYGAAIQNSGKAYLWDSEFSRVDWERGTFRSWSLFPDHGILLPRARHSPCLASLESETRADSLYRVPLSFARKVHLSSIDELFLSLHCKFSVILQFLSNLWRDFLYKVCSSSLILQIFFGVPFELD